MKQEPRLPALPAKIDMASLAKDIEEINNSIPPAKAPVELPAELNLMKQAAEAEIEAAQTVYNEAQQLLEQAKLHAEQLKQDALARFEKIKATRARVEKFSSSLLGAHKEFHNGQT